MPNAVSSPAAAPWQPGLMAQMATVAACVAADDADPGPWDPCVMAEMRQIHTDYPVL